METQFCANCGKEIALPAESGLCPECQGGQAASSGQPAAIEGASLCGFCLASLAGEEPVVTCPSCHAPYHQDCWQENGGCSVYGCDQSPVVEPRRSVEIPVSHWGRESKPCPACGKEILAAAMRCRFCGATFSSMNPEDAAAYQQRSSRDQRLPRAQRTIVWIFIFCIVPCLAPIGGIWGLIWYPLNRSDVKALPALYPALCKIGIGVGLGQTILFALLAFIYSLTGAR